MIKKLTYKGKKIISNKNAKEIRKLDSYEE